MGTDKRARQKAGRQIRLEQAREAQRKAAQRSRLIRFGVYGGLVVLIIAGALFLTRNRDQEVTATATTLPTTTLPTDLGSIPPGTNPDGTPIASTTTAITTPGSSIPPGTPTQCPPADGSAPRVTTFAEPPPMCIDPAKKYSATLVTDKGPIVMDLDATKAPKTVNNFVVLARYHYYDGTPFHRVLRGFMAQGGDAVGEPKGSGGPGYKFDDELPASTDEYVPGTVAMANSGPNTQGSQFFIYVGPNKLPTAAYSIFGHVTEGMDTTVKAIMDGGSDVDGTPPSSLTTLQTVTITET